MSVHLVLNDLSCDEIECSTVKIEFEAREFRVDFKSLKKRAHFPQNTPSLTGEDNIDIEQGECYT